MDQPRRLIALFASATPRDLMAAASGGDWLDLNTWDGVAIPGPQDAVTITNETVYLEIPAALTVKSLTLATNAYLQLGGSGANHLRLAPTGGSNDDCYELHVQEELWLRDAAKLSLGARGAPYCTALTVGGDLTLTNSATLTVYAGETGDINDVETYRQGGGLVTVAGDTTLYSGTWLYPFAHYQSGAPVRFQLQNVVIKSGSGINASNRGHGVDDSVAPPVYYGLGGQLLANGHARSGINTGSGSGGSIWVMASRLTFDEASAPKISATGGEAQQHHDSGAGGGGRIAIITGTLKAEKLAALYETGSARGVEPLYADLTDPESSPWASCVMVAGGLNIDKVTEPTNNKHGKAGSAVWLYGEPGGPSSCCADLGRGGGESAAPSL